MKHICQCDESTAPMARRFSSRLWSPSPFRSWRCAVAGAGPSQAVPGDGSAGGFAISPPASLAELSAKAEIVVMGTIGKQIETRAVPLGQSAPLGEQGKTFAATIDIASYELRVDQYLAGSGEGTITLRHAVNRDADGVDAGAPAPGETGIFFLSPAKEWGLGSYASYFGRYGRLIERDGAMVYAGPDAQPPAFARNTTLARLASTIR